MRRVLLVIAMATLVLGSATVATAGVQSRKAAVAAYARQAFTATNLNRSHHGLRALGHDRCLKQAAVRQAEAMARKDEIFHQSLQRMLRRCHLDLGGENVAWGFGSGTAAVDRGWMRSAGHRENILDPGYRLMGIAARQGPDGRWYVSQVFGRRG
jgi:uncharacterized protein YkwD